MGSARMRYLVTLATALAIAAAVAATPALAARSWAPPIQVSSSGAQAGAFAGALARGSGDSVFLWSQLQANDLPTMTGTVFSSSGSIASSQQLGTHGYWPAIASDPTGRVYAAWEFESDDGNVPDQIMLATRDPGGAFSTPTVVGDGQGGVAIAANANGDVSVMWTRYTSNGRDLIASVRPAGGSFSAPQDMSGPVGDSVNSGALATTITPSGKAVYIWAAGGLVQAVTRSALGVYGPVQTLSTAGVTAFGPQLAVDGAGNVLAMWAEGQNGAGTLREASLTAAAASFGSSAVVGGSAGDSSGLELGAAPNGQAIAVWSQYTAYSTNTGRTGPMMYSTGTTTGGFTAPAEVNGPNEYGDQLSLAVNPDGSALLAFMEFGTAELHVYRRDPGGSFQTGGGPLFCPAGSVTPVALGTGTDGTAYVGWLRNDQSYPDIALYAQHDIAAATEPAAHCPLSPPPYTVTPVSAHPGETITIDGSGAPPRNATGDTWGWDLNDDGTFEIADNPNPVVQTSFTTSGTHIVQMRASWTDVHGGKGSATWNIYITVSPAGNLPPGGGGGTFKSPLTLSAPAATSLKRALRRGIPATVNAATAARVEMRMRSATTTLGRHSFTTRRGTNKVRLHFTKAARRRLSHKRRARIRVELRAGGRRIASQTVRLR